MTDDQVLAKFGYSSAQAADIIAIDPDLRTNTEHQFVIELMKTSKE